MVPLEGSNVWRETVESSEILVPEQGVSHIVVASQMTVSKCHQLGSVGLLLVPEELRNRVSRKGFRDRPGWGLSHPKTDTSCPSLQGKQSPMPT